MKKLLFVIAFLCLGVISLEESKSVNEVTNDSKFITVEITGAVNLPGKYNVVSKTTLKELVNYAQGFMPEASITKLNLNETIEKKIYYIPFKEISKKRTITYNLNEVTYNELLLIPGVTDKRALDILLYRKNKKFDTLHELLEIKGIGEKTYEKIKQYFFI